MPKNFGGQVTLATPLFRKFSKDHVRTVPGDVLVKFEVRTFNRIGAIAINVLNMEHCSHCLLYTSDAADE